MMILQTYDTVSHQDVWFNSTNYKTYNDYRALQIGIMLYKLGPNIGYKVFSCTEEEYLGGQEWKYLVKQWFDKDAFIQKGDIK